MLSRASKILALVPKHSQSSNDEESSDSSTEVENFNLQKRDSTESSSAPSLPSSLENLHILSDDENNLTSCPTVSMKPASEIISLDSSTQDSLHSVIPPSPTAIVNVIRNKKPRFNRIVPETPESSPAIVAASPSPSNINTRSKQPRLAVRRLAPIQRKQLKFHWNNKKFEHNAEIHDKQLPSDTIKTPLEYFQYFFDDGILNMITEQSNLYSTQTIGRSLNFSTQDIKDFIAINLIMGIVNMPAYTDYWCQEFRFSQIADVMTLKKFQQIRRYIHFNDNLLDDGDRYFKVRPLIEKVRANFLRVPHETRFSIDEMMVPYKGKKAGNRKQYIKSKPRKWGYKIFVRAGVSGFIYDFLVYGGEDTFRYHLFSPEEMSLGFGAKVVFSLCKTIPDPACSVVYFDNFFTSLELIHMLRYNMGIFSLGTIRSNRLRGAEQKLIPDKALKKKGRGSYSRVVCNTNKVCIVKWHDNKVVTVASSYVSETPVGVIQRYNKDLKQRAAVPCPNIIKHYNAHMGGVDLADMLVALYRTEMKSHRWYLPIFSQMLDMCVNNSWILYRRHIGVNNIKRLSLKKFRHQIIQGLLHSGRQQPFKNYDSVPPAPKKIIKTPCTVRPTADVKYDGYNHFPTFGTKGRCKLCIKGQTTVMCIKCGMRLCLLPDRNCFFNFHNMNV